MIKYVFVILHYLTVEDTKECVQSIIELCKEDDYHIVIVDNASPNQTGKQLKTLYTGNDRITVILNKENLGFARGNNVGFMCAKKRFKAEYIIMINNDTVIVQKDFCKNIEECYRDTGFAVMGPMILSADGKFVSNPINENNLDKNEVEKRIKFVKKRLFIFKCHLSRLVQMCNKFRNANSDRDAARHLVQKKNVRLHGSCLIFSSRYIEKFNGLDDRTFMYEEERFLQKRLQDNHLVSVYNPKTVIYHKEGSSTENSQKSGRKKQLFYLSNDLKSLNILLSDF